MAILQISYAELSNSSKYAKKSAERLGIYSSELKLGISNRISNIPGGLSRLTQNALDSTNKKIEQLNEKVENLNTFSEKIDTFKENVKDTDKRVAKTIKSESTIFAKNNNMKVGKIYSFFQGLLIEKLDKSELGRFVRAIYHSNKRKLNDLKTDIYHWFRAGGGKYIKDILWSVVSIGVGIATMIVSGVAITNGAVTPQTIALFIGGGFDILNGLNNIVTSVKAYNRNNSDPLEAIKYGKMDKASDTLRDFGWDTGGTVLDTVESTALVISLFGGILKSGKKILDLFAGNGFKSIRQLFGVSSQNSVGKLGIKFMVRKDREWRITGKSFYNGLKAIFTDPKYRKSLMESVKLLKSDIIGKGIDLQVNIMMRKIAFKNIFSKSNRTKAIWKNFLKGDVKRTFKEGFTFISKQFTPNFKKYEDVAKIKTNYKTTKVLKNTVLGLAYTDQIKKSFENVINFKFSPTPNVKSITDNSKKISDNVKKTGESMKIIITNVDYKNNKIIMYSNIRSIMSGHVYKILNGLIDKQKFIIN